MRWSDYLSLPRDRCTQHTSLGSCWILGTDLHLSAAARVAPVGDRWRCVAGSLAGVGVTYRSRSGDFGVRAARSGSQKRVVAVANTGCPGVPGLDRWLSRRHHHLARPQMYRLARWAAPSKFFIRKKNPGASAPGFLD